MTRERVPLTLRQAVDQFFRVTQPGTRTVGPVIVYPALAAFIAAYDQRDPIAALPQFSELGFLAIKKSGKTLIGAALALYELVFASAEPNREILLLAATYEQATNRLFDAAVRFTRLHPIFESLKIFKNEIIHRENVIDSKTGGRHVEEHVLRAVGAKNAPALHGANATLTIYDELHTHEDYNAVEATAPSPARRCPRSVYLSYAGLRHQAHEGVPLWDLWQRWKGGSDPRLHVTFIGGPEGWRAVPWITESFIASQRRQFAAVPSKFRRLWLNEWASGDEGSFLSGEEIAAALDLSLHEPAFGVPGIVYAMGIDLGLTRDLSAVVISHVTPDGILIPDVIKTWQGSKGHPVSLEAVAGEVLALSRRFALKRVVLDQWQGAMMAEGLKRAGLNVRLITCGPSQLDQWATRLKAWFVQRTIRIPNHPQLIEQLETLRGVESRRRDLIRFTEGTGQHDDAVVALVLSAEAHGTTVGVRALPPQRHCYRRQNGLTANCYLFGATAWPSDPICRQCPSHLAVSTAWRQADPATRGEIGTFAKLNFKRNVMLEIEGWAALRETWKRDPFWG